ARRECIRIAGASDCYITQLIAENWSECSDLCVSTPRARERRLQGVRDDSLWRILIGLPRSFTSKFHNCVSRYRDFKNPGADLRSVFLRSDLLTGGYNCF
ncbi:hypothetical protein TSAR_002346, partial [Trichomalopsis sarcophagae]